MKLPMYLSSQLNRGNMVSVKYKLSYKDWEDAKIESELLDKEGQGIQKLESLKLPSQSSLW